MAERYELIKLLGKGGFGRVFLARYHGEAGFQKDVALKFLKPSARDDRDLIARLRDEARLLGLLQHRSIVQVDRLIRLQGAWVIVMEYVPGADLLTLMGNGPLPPGPALEIVYEVASALTAAYERTSPDGQPLHLTHRDIKPGNIRLTGFGDVKVLDFGIARAEFAGQEAGGTSSIVGTPSYMAPERFDGIDGPAGDVYGLGVVACEMLTGARFGRVKSTRRAHRAAVKARLELLGEVDGLPEEAKKLVGRMLHHEPTMRPLPAAVGRASRKLASRCTLTLAEWIESAMRTLPAAADPSGEDGPRTAIVVDGATADLLQGSMLGAMPEGLDLTGQLIGQSLTPDNLAGADGIEMRGLFEDSSTMGDLLVEDHHAASEAETEPKATEAPEVPIPPTPDRRGVSVWLVGLLILLLVGIVAQPYLRTANDEAPHTVPSTGPVAPQPSEREPEASPSTVLPPDVPDDPPVIRAPAADAAGPAPEPARPPKPDRRTRESPAPAPSQNSPTPRIPAAEAPAPDAKPAPAPSPTPDPVPAAPKAPVGVAVGLDGDAQWVALVGSQGRFTLPTRVPPGQYEIQVTFPGEAAESAGRATVKADTPLTVSCESFFRQCKLR